MLKIERTSKLVQGSAHRVGAWVKLIQKDMGVATGKLAGFDLNCKTVNLDRGGSVVLKDAGVVEYFWLPCKVQMQHPSWYTQIY